MNKILIIAKREFLVKVRKKAFLIMTILGPVFFAGILIVPTWFKTNTSEKKLIYLSDETGYFKNLTSGDRLTFQTHYGDLDDAKLNYIQGDYLALLYVPISGIDHPNLIRLYSKKKVPLKDIQYIEATINQKISSLKISKLIRDYKINDPLLGQEFRLQNESITQFFDEGTGEAAGIIGLILAILIYFFILLYGLQVMRSIMEEKSSRIVEVLISSIKPFELMMGKILGVALVSFLQFITWLISSSIVGMLIKNHYGKSLRLFEDDQIEQTLKNGADLQQSMEWNEVINSFNGVEAAPIIVGFLFFFIGGYLLYSSIFAAIGAIVDNETDLQQFMLPVTLPLFFCFLLISTIMEQPFGKLAFWLSMFPLTSPVIMMVRLPYGVPAIELFSSVFILTFSFLLSTWCAAKIYRTGILLHGKKIGYRDLILWLRSK